MRTAHTNETYIYRIDDNEELVVLRVRNGAAGPSPEHEIARYPKNTWRSIGELPPPGAARAGAGPLGPPRRSDLYRDEAAPTWPGPGTVVTHDG